MSRFKLHPLWIQYWAVVVLAVALFIGSFVLMDSVNGPYEKKSTYNAELIDAYEYGDHCGSKGRDTCTAWMGRFRENETGKVFDQETNGFFYHRFVDQGKIPLPAYIQLSREDFGAKAPWYGKLCVMLNFLTFMFAGLWTIMRPFAIATDDYDRKKAREREKRIGYPSR